MFLATHPTPLDHVIEAHPVWTAVVLLASMVAVGTFIQWKHKRDLQPLCDDLGFAFVPGTLSRVVRGTVAGRDVTVTVTSRSLGQRSVYRYVEILVRSGSDAGVRFAAARCPKFLRWWAGADRMDGVELQAASIETVDFDRHWDVEMDQVWCAPDIFDADVCSALNEVSRGFGRHQVRVSYNGAAVRIEIPGHPWRSDATAVQRALDAAVLLDRRLQGGYEA